jgi:bacteriocin-like protein
MFGIRKVVLEKDDVMDRMYGQTLQPDRLQATVGTVVGTALERPQLSETSDMRSLLPPLYELTEEELAQVSGGCLINNHGVIMACGCALPKPGWLGAFLDFLGCL